MSCVSGVIHKLGFAAIFTPVNAAAMRDLETNPRSIEPHSARL